MLRKDGGELAVVSHMVIGKDIVLTCEKCNIISFPLPINIRKKGLSTGVPKTGMIYIYIYTYQWKIWKKYQLESEINNSMIRAGVVF